MTSIFIKDSYKQIRVQLDDILFIEAAGNYTKIYMEADISLSTRVAIGDMQLHRAYIVSRNKISKFDRAQLNINHHTIPIGATYSQCIQDFY